MKVWYSEKMETKRNRSQEISIHTYKNLVYDKDEEITDNFINDVSKLSSHLREM